MNNEELSNISNNNVYVQNESKNSVRDVVIWTIIIVLDIVYVAAFGANIFLGFISSFSGDHKVVASSYQRIIVSAVFLGVFLLCQILWDKTNKNLWLALGLITGIILAVLFIAFCRIPLL